MKKKAILAILVLVVTASLIFTIATFATPKQQAIAEQPKSTTIVPAPLQVSTQNDSQLVDTAQFEIAGISVSPGR